MWTECTRRACLRLAEKADRAAKRLRTAAHRAAPSRKLGLAELHETGWRAARVCQVLSTGRCGTYLLTRIFQLSSNVCVEHAPRPQLLEASRSAYERFPQATREFAQLFKSSREEYVLRAAERDQIYIETQSTTTFFAPCVPTVFPNCRFIHLVRHPGQFVRSGMRREWYTGRHDHDFARIVPADPDLREAWRAWSRPRQIAWLWNETNQFIESFKMTLPAEQCRTLRSEDLFNDPNIAKDLFHFLELPAPAERAVRRLQRKRLNAQRRGNFPLFEDWTPELRSSVAAAAALASHYGYSI